jgi:hypothetical protein
MLSSSVVHLLDRVRLSLQRTIRQAVLFVLGGAVLMFACLQPYEHIPLSPLLLIYYLVAGVIIGLPLWFLYRVLRFAFSP